MKHYYESDYNDPVGSLATLAGKVTAKTKDEIVTARKGAGLHGLLRLISENLKAFVTREEMTAAINAAVTAAINAHLEAEHTSTETPAGGDNTEPTA